MVPGAKRWEEIDGITISRFHYLWPATENLAEGAILDNMKKSLYQKLQLPFLMASFSYRVAFRALIWRPNLIHAHWLIPGGLVAKLFGLGTKRVITTHGGDVYALNQKPLRALKRWILRGTKAVTTVNSDMADNLLKSNMVTDATVIPMGVSITPVQRVKVPGQIVFVGRLVEKKGLQYLLQALQNLPQYSLKVIGDGPLMSKLTKQAQGLKVEFLGQRSKQQVIEIISESEIMVIPSVVAENGDREGLPVTLMEAAACKTAVIASDLTGINDVVIDNQTGLLVPQRDAIAIAEALVRLSANDQLRTKLAENLHIAGKQFDIDVVAADFSKLMLGVMK